MRRAVVFFFWRCTTAHGRAGCCYIAGSAQNEAWCHTSPTHPTGCLASRGVLVQQPSSPTSSFLVFLRGTATSRNKGSAVPIVSPASARWLLLLRHFRSSSHPTSSSNHSSPLPPWPEGHPLDPLTLLLLLLLLLTLTLLCAVERALDVAGDGLDLRLELLLYPVEVLAVLHG